MHIKQRSNNKIKHLTFKTGQSESIKQSVKDERLQNMIKSMIDDPDPIKAIKDKLKNDPSFADYLEGNFLKEALVFQEAQKTSKTS